jgi:thioredoxin reductase (NADPH)
MSKDMIDVVIVGAGPAGMAAGIYAGRARYETVLFDKGIPGGQILLTDWVENYPGFHEGIVPVQLIENFRKQLEKFGAQIKMAEVKKIHRHKEAWKIVAGEEEHTSRSVILAPGSSYKKLGIEGESKLTGKGVSYCATCDAPFFREKDVGVVGGGDNALTEAIFLTKFCRKVYIIHRRDQFRGEKILHERALENPVIEVLWDTVVEKISGEMKLESVQIMNVKTKSVSDLKLDGLFIAVGMIPNTSFIQGLVKIDETGQIKVGKQMNTSQPGIFAAGDVTDACPSQMATAVGSGVVAALAVTDYLTGLT